MSHEKRDLKEKDQAAHAKERHQKPVESEAAEVDPSAVAYQEALGKAESEFEFASKTGDKKLISNAAQKLADIKEQERVRLANLKGYAERLVDTDPQDD